MTSPQTWCWNCQHLRVEVKQDFRCIYRCAYQANAIIAQDTSRYTEFPRRCLEFKPCYIEHTHKH